MFFIVTAIYYIHHSRCVVLFTNLWSIRSEKVTIRLLLHSDNAILYYIEAFTHFAHHLIEIEGEVSRAIYLLLHRHWRQSFGHARGCVGMLLFSSAIVFIF